VAANCCYEAVIDVAAADTGAVAVSGAGAAVEVLV
jgi:hypothetical protein